MERSRLTEEQIIGILKEQEAGMATAEVCRKDRISIATFYKYKAKGRNTAPALATRCSVSLRTICRALESLSAEGFPVCSERGAAGGYRLLGGYRMRLNGLSAREAQTLFLASLAGPAEEVG